MRTTALLRLCIAIAALFVSGSALAQDKPVNRTEKQKDEEIAALKKRVDQQDAIIKSLTERLDRLDKGKEPQKPSDEPPIPEIALPGASSQSKEPPAPRALGSFNPDITVIGNNFGRFFSVKGDPDRNRIQLGEFELALEQPVFPGIKFRAQLAGGADEGFGLGAEEAYVTFARVGKLPFGGELGKRRLMFGKANPVHPHARSYVDQPAALGYLLHPETLSGNGASLNYLFPFKNLFANFELGFWKASAAEDGTDFGTPAVPNVYPIGFGGNSDMPTARLWLSTALGAGSELEIGGSHLFSRGDNGDKLSLTGLDVTYRKTLGAFKRMRVQGEAFWHKRSDAVGGTGAHTRSGHYVLASYKPNQYYEYAARYDNSQLPWPFPGREQALSLIWTNLLNETTLFRLQYKHGDRVGGFFLPEKRGFNEMYLQFIWGAGSHSHPLR